MQYRPTRIAESTQSSNHQLILPRRILTSPFAPPSMLETHSAVVSSLTGVTTDMPKLTPIQWVLVLVFLVFYGFAVFALTRDYYLRNPSRVAAVPVPPAQNPNDPTQTSPPTWLQKQMQGGRGTNAAAVSGDDPVLLNEQGDNLFVQKRYAEAIPFYQRVLDLDPDDIDAHNDLGLALHYVGQSAQAIDILNKGAEKAPNYQRIWLSLGFVSANAGDSTAARKALETARTLDPDNPIGKEADRLLGLVGDAE